jgi:pimeloyl-ACP methyl ester carboxylesterase
MTSTTLKEDGAGRTGGADATPWSLPGARHRLRVTAAAGTRADLDVVLYDSGTPERPEAPPLLLVHGVDATASAFEMEPVFVRQARYRRVVALDLPGFGASDKPDIDYTPALMTDAVLSALDWIGPGLIDLMALSLGCEFAAEAVLRRPANVRSLALISPTGMESRRANESYVGGRTREVRVLRHVLRGRAAGPALYRLLTTRTSMNWFLSRAWGDGNVDPRLLTHGRRVAAQPGACHAPLDFVGGALFTQGIVERYRLLALPLWVSHGGQGPFNDMGACPARSGGRGVGRAVFDTGAMPHFSMPTPFEDAYLRFLDGLGRSRKAPSNPARPVLRALLPVP